MKPSHTKTCIALAIAGFISYHATSLSQSIDPGDQQMQLGAFSVSLAVKDLQASHEFYSKLGFTQAGGNPEQNWLVLRNGTTTIGLFHGMFDKNILTFNPGWGANAEPIESFTDVRDLKEQLRAKGLEILQEAEVEVDGPASFALTDPDGNTIYIDQHVPKPEK